MAATRQLSGNSALLSNKRSEHSDWTPSFWRLIVLKEWASPRSLGSFILPMSSPSVLFVCRHNSCRSQMAEGFGRYLFGDGSAAPFFTRVESAALEGQSKVNPDAIATMSELDIDITAQSSKMIDTLSPSDFSIIISMCGCGATVPDTWKEGKRFEDWNVTDPTGGSVADFETARNEIQDRVKELVESIKEDRPPTYSLYYADVCPLPNKR